MNGDARAAVELRELESEVETSQKIYQSFLARYKEIDLQEGLQQPDAQIISPAEAPVQPSGPRKGLLTTMSGLIGIFLGTGLALLRERLQPGFVSAEQLEQASGYRVLGTIPQIKRKLRITPEEYILDNPLSLFHESVRSVSTAIRFTTAETNVRTIAITSSMPLEGKSTFSLSLARSLALAGHHVLLIDADLRRPQIARLLGNQEADGLAEFLLGNCPLAEVLQVDPRSGLHYVGAGSGAMHPQELLASQQMRRLLKFASETYHAVIIDSPPVKAVTDAAVLSTCVDMCIYLVQWGETPRETAIDGIRQLARYGGKIGGLVLNQDQDAHRYYKHTRAGGELKKYYSDGATLPKQDA
jgi:polysaccharide biosynthesis transport protein